ncbi:hypothetical protein V7S79_10605 [Aquirufa sp. ROCK-SH2]
MTQKNLKSWINSNLVVALYLYAAEGISQLLKMGESFEETTAWKYFLIHILSLTSLFILLTPYKLIGIENADSFYGFLGFIHFGFITLGCAYQLSREDV